jgi:hypothetical protein
VLLVSIPRDETAVIRHFQAQQAARSVRAGRRPVRHQGRATRNLLPKLEADLKVLTKAYNTKRKIGAR